jgi:hypothetical protein
VSATSPCHLPTAFSDNFLRNKHFHESVTVRREHVKLRKLRTKKCSRYLKARFEGSEEAASYGFGVVVGLLTICTEVGCSFGGAGFLGFFFSRFRASLFPMRNRLPQVATLG